VGSREWEVKRGKKKEGLSAKIPQEGFENERIAANNKHDPQAYGFFL
jgi:hypothetical protein